MYKKNVSFAEFLNPCIGKIFFDSSFTMDQMSEGSDDYFQVLALKNHFNFLEYPLPCKQNNLQDAS